MPHLDIINPNNNELTIENNNIIIEQDNDTELTIVEQNDETNIDIDTDEEIETEVNVIHQATTSKHNLLSNLDFEHSGHTGFASQADLELKYTKPSEGIPITDLTIDIQNAIGLANTAVQPNQLPIWVESGSQPTNVTNGGLLLKLN